MAGELNLNWEAVRMMLPMIVKKEVQISNFYDIRIRAGWRENTVYLTLKADGLVRKRSIFHIEFDADTVSIANIAYAVFLTLGNIRKCKECNTYRYTVDIMEDTCSFCLASKVDVLAILKHYNKQDENCCICLDPLVKNGVMKLCNNGHFIHLKCSKGIGSHCPLCKEGRTTDENVKDINKYDIHEVIEWYGTNHSCHCDDDGDSEDEHSEDEHGEDEHSEDEHSEDEHSEDEHSEER